MPAFKAARTTIASLLVLSLHAGNAFAQTTSAYTDANTGISFQRFQDSTTTFSWGIALPKTVGTDFIGQIVSPLTNGSGWGGVTLTGGMVGGLLIVAWPSGNDVVHSFRLATGYANPPVYTGNATLTPIPSGTFVNSTHFALTFLCAGCITADSLSFAPSVTSGVMGYALAATSPSDAADAGATLTYHSAGFGEFDVLLADAQSADYEAWAALATSGASSTVAPTSTATASASATASTTASAPTATTTSDTTYDAIVVGGGPAGIIVAERLSESGASVLLLERGPASLFASGGTRLMPWNSTATVFDVPAMAYELSALADASHYCTDTASQAGCLLGGGSSVNALMFVRPQPADFDDAWPAGWKWADVAAAAARVYARNPGTSLPSGDGARYDQAVWDVMSGFLANNSWAEVDALAEPARKHAVYARPPWNIAGAERSGAVRSYLPLAQARDNFELRLGAKVVRVVRAGASVAGVELDVDGAREIVNVNAGGKVVLAAGALSTPRVLFNSGIGPAAQLGIVQNGTTGVALPAPAEWLALPVGEHLMDHPIFTLTLQTTASNFSAYDFAAVDTAGADAGDVAAYNGAGSGILAQGGQRLAFWTSVPGSDGRTRFVQGTVAPKADDMITVKAYLTHGLTSSGALGITPDGATAFTRAPWMNTDADKAAMAGFLDTFLAYVAGQDDLRLSGAAAANATGESLIASYTTGAHFVGTARMGASDDGTAVVDTDTRVFGTDNLFVVDASIHPDVPTGNTQAIVMVVAEKAAEKIIAFKVGANSSTSAAVPSSTAASGSATATASETSAVVTSTAAPENASSVPLSTVAPSSTAESSSSAPSSLDTRSSAAASSAVPASSASLPSSAATSASTTRISSSVAPSATAITDANTCWNNYNQCIDASQPQPDWTGCSATRDACLQGAHYVRVRRSGHLGRLLR